MGHGSHWRIQSLPLRHRGLELSCPLFAQLAGWPGALDLAVYTRSAQHSPAIAGRRRVGLAVGAHGAHLEAVTARTHPDPERGGAGPERPAVELAFEAGPALRGAER